MSRKTTSKTGGKRTGPMTVQPDRGWQQQPMRQTPSKVKRTVTAVQRKATAAAAKVKRRRSLELQRRVLETVASEP